MFYAACVPQQATLDAASGNTNGSDSGLVDTAATGYRYVSGEETMATLQFTTAAGTAVHQVAGYDGVNGVAFGDDRVIFALQGPQVSSPD